MKAVRPQISSEVPASAPAFPVRQATSARAPTSRRDFGDLDRDVHRRLGEQSTQATFEQWDARRSRSERG